MQTKTIASVEHVTYDTERDMPANYYRTYCPCTGILYAGNDEQQAQAEAGRHNRMWEHR